MFLEVDPGNGDPLPEGGRIVAREHRAGHRPGRVPLGARHRHARLPEAADLGRRQGPRRPRHRPARGLQAVRAASSRPRARDRRRSRAGATNLKRLVNHYGLLVEELGDKDQELTRLVQQANAVFARVRVRGRERLGVRLEAARDARTRRRPRSPSADKLGDELGPTLESLRPAFRELDDANAAVIPLAEEGTPIVRDEIRPFARIAQPYTRDFGTAAGRLADAGPDLSDVVPPPQPLLQHGRVQPGRRRGAHRRTRRTRRPQPPGGLPLLARLDRPEHRQHVQRPRRHRADPARLARRPATARCTRSEAEDVGVPAAHRRRDRRTSSPRSERATSEQAGSEPRADPRDGRLRDVLLRPAAVPLARVRRSGPAQGRRATA